MCLLNIPFQNPLPLPAHITSTLLGTVFTRFWNVAEGIIMLLQPQEHYWSQARYWCQTRWPVVQSAFQLLPKVFRGVEARVLSRPLRIFQANLSKPHLYRTHCVHLGIVMPHERHGCGGQVSDGPYSVCLRLYRPEFSKIVQVLHREYSRFGQFLPTLKPLNMGRTVTWFCNHCTIHCQN